LYWEENMSGIEDENQEHLLKWIIRYVMIPVSLAVITGLFALEVINREIDSRRPPEEDIAGSIFATMTAVAPTAQPIPSRTPTTAPTATQEANLEETGEPVAEAPQGNVPSSGQTAVCGQVPTGWQLYTVQPGDTLFSLARETGTTVDTIRQVNCLYGELLAYSQIWLPDVFVARPEPTATNTPTEEPTVLRPTSTATTTATATATEPTPTPLPDVINDNDTNS
jgi:LysM repeat protein